MTSCSLVEVGQVTLSLIECIDTKPVVVKEIGRKWREAKVGGSLNPIGEISWVELYILYARHGGILDEAKLDKGNPLRKNDQLRSQLAEFKSLSRKIGKYAVDEKKDWQLQIEYNWMPRLRNFAVEDGR